MIPTEDTLPARFPAQGSENSENWAESRDEVSAVFLLEHSTGILNERQVLPPEEAQRDVYALSTRANPPVHKTLRQALDELEADDEAGAPP